MLDEQQLQLDKYEIDVTAETERMRIMSEANRPQTNIGE